MKPFRKFLTILLAFVACLCCAPPSQRPQAPPELADYTVGVRARYQRADESGRVSHALGKCHGVAVSARTIVTAGHCADFDNPEYQTNYVVADGMLLSVRQVAHPANALDVAWLETIQTVESWTTVSAVREGRAWWFRRGAVVPLEIHEHPKVKGVVLAKGTAKKGDSGSGLFDSGGGLIAVLSGFGYDGTLYFMAAEGL